jgi:signal transduction histidine kinase
MMQTLRRIESLVRIGIIALALYLAAASVAMYFQVDRLRAAQQWVQHTQDVRYALQDTFTLILDAESAQRGYSLTKRDIHMSTYASAVAKLHSTMDTVQGLVDDNADQKERFHNLRKLIERKLEQLVANIAYTDGTDRVTAVENGKSGISRATMVEIREGIHDMLSEENRLFIERSAEMQGTVRMTIATFVALLVLFAMVAAAYFILANRNSKIRTAMLKDLMEANAKTERADKFKGDLLNYLGAALYEPLSKVATSTDLLLYRTDNALSEKDTKIVTEIRALIRFLLSLATNFLHIGRLQAGKPLELDEDDCDLVEIVREAVGIVGGTAEKSGITIQSTLPFGRALIRCDKQKLRQIFLNLLDNAVKHTPNGGKVELSAQQTSTGDVALTIHDNGAGIPPERLKQVMVPFAQIENMFARQEQGIGLGLPMALGFAQAHGGTINLDSDRNRGTTATVIFPASRVIRIFAPA